MFLFIAPVAACGDDGGGSEADTTSVSDTVAADTDGGADTVTGVDTAEPPDTTTVADSTAADTAQATDTTATDVQSGVGNPDSVGYGAKKSIAIDGANTGGEWGDDTLLIRDPAADDARFLGTNWTAHEPPWDYAALHAAWDDGNLYIGIQYVNVTDVLDPANLGSSEGSPIQVLDLIQFVAFDTVPGGYSTGGDMWSKDHEFVGDDRPDFQLYFHSNFSQEGTYLSEVDGSSTLVQFTDGNLDPTLKGAGGEFFVGAALPGVEPTADDGSPGDYGATVVDYIADKGHDTGYDTFFELQVPLSLLGLTASDLDAGTIGVFAANGDGSAVDSIPNDPATSDTPGVSASNSPLEWRADDDDDQYSVPFALIGTP